jgi:hypothetical protein
MKFLKLLSVLFLFAVTCHAQDETFSWETAKVSNKLPLTVAYGEFQKIYKKADSIAAPLPGQTCGTADEEKVQMVYYKGARYEMDNGVMNFRELDLTLRKNMYMQQKDDWFDHTTTLKSFSKTYPDAALIMVTEYDDNEDATQVISLLPPEAEADCEWKFYFKNNKLQRIVCEFSCD